MGGDTIKYSTLNTDAFRVTKVFNAAKWWEWNGISGDLFCLGWRVWYGIDIALQPKLEESYQQTLAVSYYPAATKNPWKQESEIRAQANCPSLSVINCFINKTKTDFYNPEIQKQNSASLEIGSYYIRQ